MSTLLPPTSETLQHVLTQGGIPPWLAGTPDPAFDAFLAETRRHVASGSFERVLEVCLDSATDALFRGVEKHVFGSHQLDDTLTGAQEPRERLAAMLPGLARWCHMALEGLPNELVDVRTPFLAPTTTVRLVLIILRLTEFGGLEGSFCAFCHHLYQL